MTTKERLLVGTFGVSTVSVSVLWGVILHKATSGDSEGNALSVPDRDEIPFQEPREYQVPDSAILPKEVEIASRLSGEIFVRRLINSRGLPKV